MARKNRKGHQWISVMVEEEHDDALPDDAEPGHLLPQHPAEFPSSSPALPLAATTPRPVHPKIFSRANEQRHGGCVGNPNTSH